MAPKSSTFYAVRKGHRPGVYLTWSECETQAKGYPNAKYKKFATRAEAEDFVRGIEPSAGAVAAPEGNTNALAGPSRDTVNQPASTSTTTSSDREIVYSDGACKGNGKPGSIAGVGVWWGPNDPRNIAERCPGDQTNNRAELIAILRVLEETPVSKRTLEIKTDSQYSIKCFQQWIRKWKNSGWKSAKNEPVKNVGIIRLIDAHLDRRSRLGQPVLLSYVKGHSGDVGNDGADAQANLGATLPPVPERDWAQDEELLKQDQEQAPEVPQKVIKLAQDNAVNVLPVGSSSGRKRSRSPPRVPQAPNPVSPKTPSRGSAQRLAAIEAALNPPPPDSDISPKRIRVNTPPQETRPTTRTSPRKYESTRLTLPPSNSSKGKLDRMAQVEAALAELPESKRPHATTTKVSGPSTSRGEPANTEQYPVRVIYALPPLVPVPKEEINLDEYADCLLDADELENEI